MSQLLDWFHLDDPVRRWLIAFGFLGQFIFFGRWIIQWVASERRKESHVPELLRNSSVSSKALYCDVSDASGSVRMRTKSSVVSDLSSTRIGKRPCSSGIRSDGLDTWNAPDAMNRM